MTIVISSEIEKSITSESFAVYGWTGDPVGGRRECFKEAEMSD
jgi:hypothetical protein